MVLHVGQDISNEDGEKPTRYNFDKAPRDAINKLYEDFLQYNEINPEDVTVERVNSLLEVKKVFNNFVLFKNLFFFAYSSVFAMRGSPTYIINVLIVTLLPGNYGLGLNKYLKYLKSVSHSVQSSAFE